MGDGEQLRPKPGVRALDAGTSEAGEQATTPTVIGPLLVGYRLDEVNCLDRRHMPQPFGVTTLTSLPGTWMTRIGARPAR